MSAATKMRNAAGVLLRYEPAQSAPQQDALKFQPSDRLRCLLIRAERQALYLRIMVEHLESALSNAALERFDFALCTIEAALQLARDEL